MIQARLDDELAIARQLAELPPPDIDRLHELVMSLPMPFDFWCERYLPHYFTRPDGVIQVTPDFAIPVRDALCRPGRGKRIAICSFRGSGKTTRNHVAYALYSICELGDRFIVSISSASGEVKAISGWIQHEIETNKKLKEKYSWLGPSLKLGGQYDQWNSYDLILLNGARLAFRSYKGHLRGMNHRGRRPDKILIDDIESEETVSTEAQRENLRIKVHRTIFGLQGAEGMDIIIQGTPLHPDSLISRMQTEEQYPEWERYFSPAVLDASTHMVTWPELWPWKRLEETREKYYSQDPDGWAQEWLLIPADPRIKVFQQDAFQWINPDLLANTGETYMSVDGALGRDKGCDSSVVAGTMTRSGSMLVLDWVTGKMGIELLAATIERLADVHRPRTIFVDTTATQEVFVDYFKLKGSKHHFTGISEKSSKEGRIESLIPHIAAGRIRFHEDWRMRKDYAVGMKQLLNYPQGMVDGPDALELLYSQVRSSQVPRLISGGEPSRIETTRKLMRLTR